MDETCESCKFYKPGIANQPGECRKNPPNVFPVMAGPQSPLARPGPQNAQLTFVGAHPPVMKDHWCGGYQRKLSS